MQGSTEYTRVLLATRKAKPLIRIHYPHQGHCVWGQWSRLLSMCLKTCGRIPSQLLSLSKRRFAIPSKFSVFEDDWAVQETQQCREASNTPTSQCSRTPTKVNKLLLGSTACLARNSDCEPQPTSNLHPLPSLPASLPFPFPSFFPTHSILQSSSSLIVPRLLPAFPSVRALKSVKLSHLPFYLCIVLLATASPLSSRLCAQQ